MKDHVRHTLETLRHPNNKGKRSVPTREQVEQRRKQMLLSLKSLAKLADVSQGIIASVYSGRSVSDEMLVYLEDVMMTTLWDESSGVYIRYVNGHPVFVHKMEPQGKGWRKTGTQ